MANGNENHTDDLMLRTDDLAVGYRAQRVLEHVSMEIRAGEFWFLLGANGAGKTTLLRVVLGLLAPLAGRLWLHPALAGGQIAFVPQQCDWNETIPTTVREFVSLGLVGTRVPRHGRTERLREALSTVGLHGMERRDFWSLSGGMRQRALIARALVRDPQLLILDEPTNNLDPATEEGVLRLLEKVNRERGLTLLFVTHDVGIAARYATHVALFHGGVVETGRREEILDEAKLRRAYGVNVLAAPNRQDAPRDGEDRA
jgi:ABC-type Mn2+/Zn2+ transport system ATPase subunit